MQTERRSFIRLISVLSVVAVVAWAAFAWAYRAFFPTDVSHADSLGVWWLWLAGGTLGFLFVFEASVRLLGAPPKWRLAAAVASTAPALVCDMLTGTQPQVWLAGAGEAADARYLSLIVGGVGFLQLYAVLTSPPIRDTSLATGHGTQARPSGDLEGSAGAGAG